MTARLAARVRVALPAAGIALTAAGLVAERPALAVPGVVALLVGLALYFRVGTVRAEPLVLRAPVRGRWVALSSPGEKVPSHGVHAYGQTYAMDLVHASDVPGDDATLPWRPATQPVDAFAGFGEPVVAPLDGTVVRALDRRRDHRGRMSWPGLALWLLEAPVRELGGPSRMLGNHVVIRIREDVYVLVAHLRRGSVAVRPGDRVTSGETIAACGNSGSSTMPHVHFQVMDRPHVWVAAGLPFALAGAGAPAPPPGNGQPVVA